MLDDPDSAGRRRLQAIAAALAVAAAATTAAIFIWGPARVSGQTPAERIDAIRRIAARRPWGASDALAEAAADPDAAVRAEAVAALGRVGPEGHRGVVGAAAGDASPAVRAAAARTLVLYGDAEAAGAVVRLATDDPDAEVRRTAVKALSNCPGPQGLVSLVEIAENAEDRPDSQSQAARTLMTRLHIWPRPTDPSDRATWLTTLEVIKARDAVQEAFRAVGRTLVRRPERLPPKVDERGVPAAVE